MIIYEKLTNENIDIFNTLQEEASKVIDYKMDFYRVYDNKGFLYKFFLKKFVRLLRYNNKYIGYIWIDPQSTKSLRINDIYIKEEYFDLIDRYSLIILKARLIVTEVYENKYTTYLMNKLNFSRYKTTNLMSYDVTNKLDEKLSDGISFKVYNAKEDRKIRCYIQNSVFRNESRIPLTTSDIEFDEKQEYYINDYCIFIELNNTPIGYGQIVFNRGVYFIVNIGILNQYRNNGYAHLLLSKIINMAYSDDIKKLYIRVENDNINAKSLYDNIGFKDLGIMSSWIWTLSKN